MGVLFSWWLVVEALGIAVLPLTATLCANLPDRGWAFAKPVGLLAVGWLIWFPLAAISALPYSRGWIVGALLVFAAGNGALLRRRALRETLRRMVTEQRAYVIGCEAAFTGAFALMAWVRSFTPSVVDTEKFMDVAFVSSLWRSSHLPAPDPWLSGAPINYYHFGHFLIATLAKLLGTQPGTAFNVGIALVFALAAVAVLGVGANIVAARFARGRRLWRALPGGFASALLVLVLGNLNGAQVWWQDAQAVALSSPALRGNPWAWWLHRELWVSYEWWPPSRVIPNTINEFPAFSFVLADLHAHVLALPFCALAVGLAFNLLLARGRGLRAFGWGGDGLLSLVTTAVLIGALYAINGWDLPTYLGLALLALAIQQWLAHGWRLNSTLLVNFGTMAALLTALCFLLYLPFYHDFVSPSQGFGAVAQSDRSPIGDEVAIFGLPVFILGSLLVIRLAQGVGGWLASSMQVWKLAQGETGSGSGGVWNLLITQPYAVGGVIAGGVIAVLALWTRATAGNPGWTLLWSVVILLICAAIVASRVLSPAQAGPIPATTATARMSQGASLAEIWVFVLFGTGAALVAIAELIFVRDIFGTRMNTVFKLYFQTWLLLGIAAGSALVWLLPAAYRGFAAAVADALDRIVPGMESHGAGALAFAGAAGVSGAPEAASASASVESSLAGGRLFTQASTPARLPSGTGSAPGVSETPPRSAPEIPGALRWTAAGGMLLWMAALAVLGCAALVYPVLATSARTENFTLPRGLDGTAYMASDPVPGLVGCQVAGGTNHDDNLAIAWLNTHVQGSPVLVEAPGCEWSHYSRISAFTGLPTLLGWPGGHEGEWRTNWLPENTQGDIFAQRQQDIATIYTNPDPGVVSAMLRRYHARYVYVGAAERALYPNADLGRFGAFLRVIYNRDGVTIYETPF